MNSCVVVNPPAPEIGAANIDRGVRPMNVGIVGAATCDCGLPERCCENYCDIEDCDWMVY